jgi:hypothetical protein
MHTSRKVIGDIEKTSATFFIVMILIALQSATISESYRLSPWLEIQPRLVLQKQEHLWGGGVVFFSKPPSPF